MADENAFPTQAQVVIIGGGVIGCSVAYHLTKLGWTDVVLLERKQLTSGTTWHAAGLMVCCAFATDTAFTMSHYSRELSKSLEAETGLSTGFRDVGYLELATTQERVLGLRRVADFVRNYGVDVHEISAAEVQKLWPLMRTDDIITAFYCPSDGRVNPVDFTMSLAKGARMGGARIIEETKVTGITQKNGVATGVVTDKGTIQAEYVVNCAGLWGNEVGRMAGVNVPLQASEHYYLITEPIEGIHRDLPIFEDPECFAYYREETGGLMLGLFEPVAGPWGMNGVPEDFAFGELPPDWDRLTPFLEKAMERIPIAKTAGVHKLFCGPESFTADLGSLMGEAPELRNFYVACGFSSLGILFGGGAGQVMAQWIVDGIPPVDVAEIDVARVSRFQNTPKYRYDRTVEILGWMYSEGWPNKTFKQPRNVRKSALHDRLVAAGAHFIEYAGWEFPEWFAPEGVEPKVEYSWERQNWFEYNAAEHKAAREGVVLMDVSVMSKFLVQGRDAEKVLNRICANTVAVPVGKIVYTQWLNERGQIQADLTVTRTAEDAYFLAVSPVSHNQALAWLRRHTPEDAHCFVTDVTSGYALINVQGPKSRKLLSKLTHADLSNDAFPYMTMQEIDINYALVNAVRITYLGELGWELYVPTEFVLHVFDSLVEAGKSVGLKQAGLAAMDTCRMEKFYRDYGTDTDNTDTPLTVGLGFAVDFDKPGGFIGKDALLQQKNDGVKKRLAQFLLEDPEPLLFGSEPIYRNGEYAGYISIGAYGHTLGGAVGLGHVENEAGVNSDYVLSGKYEIAVAGERFPAKVSLRPMYDPKNERVRA